MDFEDFMKKMMSEGKQRAQPKSYDEQKEKIRKFLEKKADFKIGDFVSLNDEGRKLYRGPQKGNIGQIVDLFPRTVIMDRTADCYICFIDPDNDVVMGAFDSHFLKRHKENENVFEIFRKKNL